MSRDMSKQMPDPREERAPTQKPIATASDQQNLVMSAGVTPAVLAALPDAAAIYDSVGRILHANPAACALYGLDTDPALGDLPLAQRMARLAPCDALGQPLAPDAWPISRLLRGDPIPSDRPLEVRLTLRGESRLISYTGAPLRAAHGPVLGAILFGRDVSARRDPTRGTTELAADLASAIEAVPDGVAVYAADGAYLYGNHAFESLFAPRAHAADHPRPFSARHAFPRLRDPYGHLLPVGQDPLSQVMRGQDVTGTHAVDVLARLPDGHEHLLAVTGAPIHDAEGRIQRIMLVYHDVTEQMRMRQTLHDQTRQVEAAFDAMADPVVLYGRDGRMLRHNQAARRVFAFDSVPGFTDLSITERCARLKVLDPDGHPVSVPHLPQMRALRGEALIGNDAVDLQFVALDGRTVEMNVSASPLRDETGAILGAVAVFRDVSARRQLERNLTAHLAQLDVILETMPEGVILYGPDRRTVHTNSAYRALLGVSPDGMQLTRDFSDRGHTVAPRSEDGDLLPQNAWPAERIFAGEVLAEATAPDVLLRAYDGRDVLCTASGGPVYGAHGELLGAVMVLRDVTARRKVERHAHVTLTALLAMAEALVTPSDSDDSGSSESVASRLVGQTVARRLAELTSEVLGAARVSLHRVAPESGVLLPLAVAGLPAEQEEAWFSMWPSDVRFADLPVAGPAALLPPGEVLVVDMTQPPYQGLDTSYGITDLLLVPLHVGAQLVGLLVLDYAGTPHRYQPEEINLARGVGKLAALVIDRERLLRERAAARGQALALQEANRRMDEFLGIVSHELRTPLTTIMANLQIAERRFQRLLTTEPRLGTLPIAQIAPLRDLIQRADISAHRQNRLVNDLLDISRIRVGRLEMRSERLNLAPIVDECVEEQRLHHPERDIRRELPTDEMVVEGDGDRIGQVITNLLTNALKYSPLDAPVSVRLWKEGGAAHVSVHDGGPGLPPEERERVWEQFHRAPGVRVLSGSGIGLGLGLYISREIVERHGGAVGIESTVGQGSTFWFALPLATPQ